MDQVNKSKKKVKAEVLAVTLSSKNRALSKKNTKSSIGRSPILLKNKIVAAKVRAYKSSILFLRKKRSINLKMLNRLKVKSELNHGESRALVNREKVSQNELQNQTVL